MPIAYMAAPQAFGEREPAAHNYGCRAYTPRRRRVRRATATARAAALGGGRVDR